MGAPNRIYIAGNYLIIEDEKKETTEFQLKNVFYKTENKSFIIRDTTYRMIISFDDVRLYADERGNDFEVDTMAEFLQQTTGSLGKQLG